MPSWPRLAFSQEKQAAAAHDGTERFRRLILPHLDSAYRYARYLCRDGNAAEDVVQEAFLRALKAIGQCHGDARAWLFAIVRNCHHDWVRANVRHHAVLDSADMPASEEDLRQREDVGQLRRMIENLPEPFREALVLRELEELSYREIAEVTGAPLGTVMSRLARARQMLSASLLGEDDTGRKGKRA